MVVAGGSGSQQLLSLNSTTVLVVLLLGLLFGCDNLINFTKDLNQIGVNDSKILIKLVLTATKSGANGCQPHQIFNGFSKNPRKERK